jgi:hypothetical protein
MLGLGCGEARETSVRERGVDPSTNEQASAQGSEPEVEAPTLMLCEKYFPQEDPTGALRAVVGAFWAGGDCATAGLFESTDETTVAYLNHLRNWTLERIGCESPHPVPGGPHPFALSWLWGERALAAVDVEALIDGFMDVLLARVPLSDPDAASLRELLVASSASVSQCDCRAQLDRCEDGASRKGILELSRD